MNSPNPGQPIHTIKPLPTPQSAALGASGRVGAARSVSTTALSSPSPVATPTASVAAPSFNPLNLMRPAPTMEALQAKTRAMLYKVREEEVARDTSLRRAHLLMLSLGRDYRNMNNGNNEGVVSALNKNKYVSDSSNSPLEHKQQVTDMTLDEVFDPLVEDLNDADIVYDRCLDQSRGIAHRIGGTTRIAEVSSTHVKRLDVLLSRVHETKTLVESILEKESQLEAMAGAMRANDLVKASEAVGAYELSKRRVLIARHRRLGVAGLKSAFQPSPSKGGSPNSEERNTNKSVLEQMLHEGVPEDRIPLELFSDESDKSDLDDDDDGVEGALRSKQHTNISESFDACEDDEAYYHAGPDGLVGETTADASNGRARGKSTTVSKTAPNAPSLTKKKKMSIAEERALVLKVKEALIGRIRDQLAQAVASGKREEVIKAVQLLAKVQPPPTAGGDHGNTPQREHHRGKNAFLLSKNNTTQPATSSSSASASVGEACLSYVQWVCDAALKELTARVDGELQTLKRAKNNEQSHLGSAAAALDHVVATLEQEEAFVAETFGKEGLVTLLESLHKRCTSDVVRIIRDYLSMRKISSTAAKTTTVSGNNTNGGSGHAKRLDQTLEEIAHLVCCCHMYMRYVDERYHEALLEGSALTSAAAEGASGENKKTAKATNSNTHKDEGAGAVFDRSHYSAFVTKDNPLFEAIQELLAVFIPMQKEYFTTAFAQSIEMDREVLASFAVAQAKERARQLGLTTEGQHSASRGGGGGGSDGGGIFGTLNSLVSNSNNPSAAIAGGSGPNGANIKELLDDPTFSLSSPAPDVVFVDDLFYVLRIAVHRAFSTRSNIIASSILMAVTELITDSVAKEVLRRIRVRPDDEGAVLRGSVQTLSGILSAAASAASANAMLPSSSTKKSSSSAAVLLGTAKGGHHTPQQLEALFHDLSSGRNLYSPTLWLTQELLAKEERGRGGNKQSKATSHFLDIDPLTMLPTGRGISASYHSPQPFASSSSSVSAAAESSTTLHQSRLFQWVAAAFNMCLYLRKLSKDVEPLSTQYFGDSRADLVRFREQRHEMESIAFWLEENVKLALCDLCYSLAEEHFVSPVLMKGFMAAQYSMSEEEFAKLDRLASIMSPVAGTIGSLASYNNNNNASSAVTNNSSQQQQLWVGPLVSAWSAATRRLRAQLSQREEVFELVMNNIIEQIAHKFEHCIIPEGIWVPADSSSSYGDSNSSAAVANDEVRVIDGVKMVFSYPPAPKPMVVNDYGALQLDKDMRQLRGHFLNTIDGNVPIRERFARLSAITTLLLVDRIEDVPDVCLGLSEALSAEDKRRVLLMKSGLASPAEIKALKL